MTDAHDRILAAPVERGALPAPTGESPALVLGASAAWRPPEGTERDAFVHVQPFRPDFLALQRAGHSVFADFPAGRFAYVYIQVSRYRARTESWTESALAHLRPGGWLVVGGGLKNGADAIARRLAKRFPGGERLSKHHGVAFHVCVADPEAARLPAAPNHFHIHSGWVTAPGAFSADEIDPASRLLVENLPADMSGRVADFGAGWGYLAGEIATRFPGVCHVDLYEADHEALGAAKANLAHRATSVEAGFFWFDLASEAVPRRYDVIAMNPPFHQGRAADPAMGLAFIVAAAKALKPGGRLFMVANRRLPYETALAKEFSRSGETAGNPQFKILWAVR